MPCRATQHQYQYLPGQVPATSSARTPNSHLLSYMPSYVRSAYVRPAAKGFKFTFAAKGGNVVGDLPPYEAVAYTRPPLSSI